MFDSSKAYDNGIVLVNISTEKRERFQVVCITGTNGENASSHWRGVVQFTGNKAQCEEWINKRTNKIKK